MKIIEKIFSGITAIQLIYLFMSMLSGTIPSNFNYTITFSDNYIYTFNITLSQLLIASGLIIGFAMVLGISVVGSGFNSESIKTFMKGVGFILYCFIMNTMTLSGLDNVPYIATTLRVFIYVIQFLFFLTKITES